MTFLIRCTQPVRISSGTAVPAGKVIGAPPNSRNIRHLFDGKMELADTDAMLERHREMLVQPAPSWRPHQFPKELLALIDAELGMRYDERQFPTTAPEVFRERYVPIHLTMEGLCFAKQSDIKVSPAMGDYLITHLMGALPEMPSDELKALGKRLKLHRGTAVVEAISRQLKAADAEVAKAN